MFVLSPIGECAQDRSILLAELRASALANRTARAGVRKEPCLGQKSLLDVHNAERELVEADVKLIETRRDLVQAS